jgi:NAD(P)-dependent dehydrogenase (short-subunit alcohol dehydrogenase family)
MSGEHTSLIDKVAIVTGGGSGIGRAVALALAQAGAHLVVCGRRPRPIEHTAEAVRQAGGSAMAVQADISKPADIDRLLEATLKTFGSVDILINNAGISEDAGPVHGLDLSVWDELIAVNLRGSMLAMRAVLPHMRAQQNGHIINISSESGLEYYQGEAAYGVSKHALNDLGEYTQRENQAANIRINTICPGMVVTEMTENSPGLDHTKCLYPEDIAELVLFLLTRRGNIKFGTPILIQTMLNPWE